MSRPRGCGEAADDRYQIARLRRLLPAVMSSRQRGMLRMAISHLGRRPKAGGRNGHHG